MPRLLLALVALVLSACAASTPALPPPPDARVEQAPIEAQLAGIWRMESVFQDDVDVSAEANPSDNRWIELRADHSFASGGAPYGPDSGVWTFDTDAATLEIVSDQGPENDSVWRVSLRGGRMIWRGVGPADRVVIVSRRTG